MQEYKVPREAVGIVAYLEKEVAPASAEIKSLEDATSVINENKIFIVSAFWFYFQLLFSSHHFFN